VAYDRQPAADGLMVCWRGRRRGRLSGERWNRVLGEERPEVLAAEVLAGRLPPWGQAVVLATAVGDRVLEVGSGTGRISLYLSLGGRQVTLLDCARRSLAAARDCAARLGLAVRTVQADATVSLPFADGSFECVWSSGLLEHFDADERRRMLRDWARLAGRSVIALVPNAHCLVYRVGKAFQEEAGSWPYGLELPLASLRSDFQAAGLDVAAEFTVGAGHALRFLGKGHPLRRALANWLERAGPEAAEEAGQGYLLCTVGTPRRS
jgi:SAM-dependent methyltransferase